MHMSVTQDAMCLAFPKDCQSFNRDTPATWEEMSPNAHHTPQDKRVFAVGMVLILAVQGWGAENGALAEDTAWPID